MAGRYEATQGQFGALMPQLRQRAAASGSHRRTPEIVANLAGGFGLFLTFAASVGAVGVAEHAELAERSWRALGEAARAQAAHQAPSEPARRFLELLRGALSSGRAHVAAPDGERPSDAESAWGWRRDAYGAGSPRASGWAGSTASTSTCNPMPLTQRCSAWARTSGIVSRSRPRRCAGGSRSRAPW